MNYLLIRDATDIGLSAFTSGNNSGILDSGFIDSIGHGTTLVVNDTDVGLSIFASGNDGGILNRGFVNRIGHGAFVGVVRSSHRNLLSGMSLTSDKGHSYGEGETEFLHVRLQS